MPAIGSQTGLRSEPLLEALCMHHDVSAFTCSSDPAYTVDLENYWKRSHNPYGDRVLVAVVSGAVVGYVVSIDTDFTFDIDPDSNGLYYYASAIAVDDSHRGSTVASSLVQRTLRIIDEIEALRQRRPNSKYRGILASPEPESELAIALAKMGFRRLPGTDFMWKLR